MKKEETRQLLTLLQVAYPSAYKNMTNAEKGAALGLYFEMFRDTNTDIIIAALKNYIRANQYPPTVAGLQEQIELLTEKRNSSEGWGLISRAICNSLYHSAQEFKKLPINLQKWACSPKQLRELATTSTEILNTVTKGQFIKEMAIIDKREKARSFVAPEILEKIENNKLYLNRGGKIMNFEFTETNCEECICNKCNANVANGGDCSGCATCDGKERKICPLNKFKNDYND